ncbi:MAG: GTP-dependent dephospho-CoA kinase family protein [Candidatus Bathyarchaeota archaeon]|nr:MAG: GTP-dependent dephospho-CoA kinase family protein [Candidatus Bathyarchaeota archaeon]
MGLLIQGSVSETTEELKRLIKKEKPHKIISVGDAVSSSMIEHGIFPNVLVVDNRIMRQEINPIPVNVNQTFHVKNPPGTLVDEAWINMRNALRQQQTTRVLVDGEEDLLALVAISCAPEKSLVVYGQPHVGIVAVRVTKQKKKLVGQFVEDMNRSTKS